MSGIIGSDKVAAKYERLYEEVMRLSKSRLASINDERERQEAEQPPLRPRQA